MPSGTVNNWGLVELFSYQTNSSKLNGMAYISDAEYFLATSSGLHYYANYKLKETFPQQFTSCAYSRRYDVIIGVAKADRSIVVFNFHAGRVLTQVPTKQSFVGQLIVTDDVVITIGDGIRFYAYEHVTELFKDPRYDFRLLGSVSDIFLFNPSMPAVYSSAKQLLIYPSISNLHCYDHSGALVQTKAILPSKTTSIIPTPSRQATIPFERMCTTESDGDLKVWHKSGRVMQSYSLGTTAYHASKFINSEFVLLVDSLLNVVLLNIKTGKSMHCLKLPDKPVDVLVFGSSVFFVYTSHIAHYKANTLWRLWAKTGSACTAIARVYSEYFSPRLLLSSADSTVTLFSPKLKRKLAIIASPMPYKVMSYACNDAYFFLLLENRTIIPFVLTKNAYVPLPEMRIRASIICCTPEKLLSISDAGVNIVDIKQGDPLRFEPVRFIKYARLGCRFAHYYDEHLYLVYTHSLVRIDLETGRFDELPIGNVVHASFYCQYSLLAFSDGRIVLKNGMETQLDVSFQSHITYTFIEANRFICTSIDNDLFMADFNFQFVKYHFPFTISAAAYSGNQVLVALDHEIMAFDFGDIPSCPDPRDLLVEEPLLAKNRMQIKAADSASDVFGKLRPSVINHSTEVIIPRQGVKAYPSTPSICASNNSGILLHESVSALTPYEDEAALGESVLKETSLKETSLKETSLKETSLKETSLKETSLKETSLKETAFRQTVELDEAQMMLKSDKAMYGRTEAVQTAIHQEESQANGHPVCMPKIKEPETSRPRIDALIERGVLSSKPFDEESSQHFHRSALYPALIKETKRIQAESTPELGGLPPIKMPKPSIGAVPKRMAVKKSHPIYTPRLPAVKKPKVVSPSIHTARQQKVGVASSGVTKPRELRIHIKTIDPGILTAGPKTQRPRRTLPSL